MSSDPLRFSAELHKDPELCRHILADPHSFPPIPREPERIIKTSPENLERAICRSVARCREWGEFWKVEVSE